MISGDKKNYIKIYFDLEIYEDGFPPISVETLNAKLIDKNIAIIDNIPFFVEGVAYEDEVLLLYQNNKYFFQKLIRKSGNKIVSLIIIDIFVKQELIAYFNKEKLMYEIGKFPDYTMLSVSIKDSCQFDKTKNYLSTLENNGLISYAELCL